VVSSSASLPIVWNGLDPSAPGGNLTVLASITQAAGPKNLQCSATTVSGVDVPTITVNMVGAVGVYVDENNSGFSNFTGL
jgi:hypothetical protein